MQLKAKVSAVDDFEQTPLHAAGASVVRAFSFDLLQRSLASWHLCCR